MMISCCGFFSPNREHIHCILRLWVFVWENWLVYLLLFFVDIFPIKCLIHCAWMRSSQENITCLKLLCSHWFFMWLSYFISPGVSIMYKKLWAISQQLCGSIVWMLHQSSPFHVIFQNMKECLPVCIQYVLNLYLQPTCQVSCQEHQKGRTQMQTATTK